MIAGDLVLIHGFWSGPATWDRVAARLHADNDLRGLRVHRFGYPSPKLSWPGSWTRIPDYDDVAQSLAGYLSRGEIDGDVAIVTHSQGGLILQRFLAWMLHQGRGRELARIKVVILLACPNEGSAYQRSIRAAAGFRRHAQARDLAALSNDVADARRTVLSRIVHARQLSDRECPIPFHTYAGDSDNVVRRGSAQSGFADAETLPGNHFSILDPQAPGNRTVQTLKVHLLEAFAEPATKQTPPPPAQQAGKYRIQIWESSGIQIGDHNRQEGGPGGQS